MVDGTPNAESIGKRVEEGYIQGWLQIRSSDSWFFSTRWVVISNGRLDYYTNGADTRDGFFDFARVENGNYSYSVAQARGGRSTRGQRCNQRCKAPRAGAACVGGRQGNGGARER